MRQKIIIPFMMLILFSFFVVAETNYPNFGGEDLDYFSDDNSRFGAGEDKSFIADNKGVTDAKFLPLVEDLDNNGQNEVIILTNNKLRIYNVSFLGTEFDIQQKEPFSMYVAENPTIYSNVITYDIDVDGTKEVIFYGVENKYMYILDWNGTEMTDEGFNCTSCLTNWVIADADGSSDVMIGCGNTYGCLMVSNTFSTTAYGPTQLNMHQFDADGPNITTIESYPLDPTNNYCLPKYKSVPFANGQYYFTWGKRPSTLRLVSAIVNQSEHIIYIEDGNPPSSPTQPTNCGHNNVLFTSPTTSLYFEEDSNYAIIYGYQKDDDEFKMISYDSNFNVIDDYPDTQLADGQIIGNPFVARAFSDQSNPTSVCVVGYHQDSELLRPYGYIDVLCADEVSSESGGTKNAQFKYSFPAEVSYNLTAGDVFSPISHAIQSKTQTYDEDLSEILTPFGVFELEDRASSTLLGSPDCYSFRDCTLTNIWEQPILDEMALISVDYFGSGFEDLISLTDSNLRYIDDGFVNLNAYLKDCTEIKPDINEIWKLHIQESEQVIGLKNNTPDEFNINIGTYFSGNIFSLTEDDDDRVAMSETFVSPRRKNVTFNFTDVECLDGIGKFYVVYSSPEIPVDDRIVFQIKNLSSGVWDDILSLNMTDYGADAYNQTIFTNNMNQSGYNIGGKIELRFHDNLTQVDNSNDVTYLDKIAIECNQLIQEEVETNSTNKVIVEMTIDDVEGQPVQGKATLYYGENNQQTTGWSGNMSSGTTFDISTETGVILRPNETTASSTLRLEVKDIVNYPSTSNIYDYDFIVQSDGDFWFESSICVGDTEEEYLNDTTFCETDADCESGEVCVSSVCVELPSECERSSDCPEGYGCIDNECEELPTSLTDNSITTTFETFSWFTGLPIIILLLVFLIWFSWYVVTSDITPQFKFPLIILVSFFTIAGAVLMSFISVIWVVMMIIIAVGITTIAVARFIKG